MRPGAPQAPFRSPPEVDDGPGPPERPRNSTLEGQFEDRRRGRPSAAPLGGTARLVARSRVLTFLDTLPGPYDPGMSQAPLHYARTTRVVLRYAIVMTAVSLLSGVAFQESGKKLPVGSVDPGLRLEAILSLALVHGHVMLAAVLVPIAMLGALHLARAAGGRDVKPLTTKMLTHGYLPFATLTVLLMLYKGYHFLLAVRGGDHDLGAIDARLFGGSSGLRHAVYGTSHTVMAVALGLFLFGLWRGLRPARPDARTDAAAAG